MSTIGRNARWHFLTVFPINWEFLVQILCAYFVFLSPLEYKFLLNYRQLRQSYAILSATTQRAFQPMANILSIWWWSRLMWHNFVKAADNWIKFGSPALYAISRPSVRLSHGWISQKRLKIGSCNFHHTVAPSLLFLWDKIHPEILTGSPERGRQTRVGWGKQLFSSFMRQYFENGRRYRPKLLLMTVYGHSIDTKVDDLEWP